MHTIPEGSCHDISHSHHERWPDILSSVHDVIAVLSANGRYRRVYAGDASLLAEPAEHLVGRSVDDALPLETASHVRRVIADTLASGTMQQTEYMVHRQQQSRWFSARVAPCGTADDPCVLWVVHDVTDRKRTEEALRTAEARLAEAQRIGRVGSWEWDIPGRRIWWSENHFRLFGVDPDHFAPTFDSVWQFLHPEDRPTIQAKLTALLEHNQPFRAEFRIRRPDGAAPWMSSQGELYRDSKGQPVRVAGTVQDITEQRRTQAHDRHTQQLASLGTLAATISHEINNPISAAWSAAEAAMGARGQHNGDGTLDACLRTIAGSLRRCQTIIHNVKQLAAHQSSPKAACSLHEIIRRSIEATYHFARQAGATVAMTRDAADVRPEVNASQIEQVLVNLIRNAVEAVAKSITIAAKSIGPMVQLLVKDDGQGISPGGQNAIFDPFVTTHSGSANLGLGLAISRSIVADHGGTIEMQSKPGIGTTICIAIPMSAPRQ